MRWSRQPPVPFITENRRRRPRLRSGREGETRHAQMLAALQGSPVANPKSLKDKAQGKCLICRQAGHWAKECPNHDKSPKMACYKCHQLDIGWHSALGTRAPQSQAPSLPSRWFKKIKQPARLSQITITGLEPRVQLDVAGRSENFLVDTGLPSLS